MRSLAERVRAFEQKKARLADTEAKLKLAEKKSRLRRCIRIGDLVMRAGLADLSDDMLYGAMMSLTRESETKRRHWAVEGAEALAAQKADEDRGPMILTFAAHPTGATATMLRNSGFRFNRLLRHWEGLSRLDDAQALAESLGGVVRQVEV